LFNGGVRFEMPAVDLTPDQNALGRPLAIVSPLRSVDRVIVMVLAAAVGHLQDGKGGV
jgi:hypothetical protein